MCVCFGAAADGSDWTCITLLPHRSSPHAARWKKLPAGERGRIGSTFAATAGRKREDAHSGAAGDLEGQQKETSQMWVCPLHNFTTRNNTDAKQKNLQACNPMLCHLQEKCSTHVATTGGGTARGWQSPGMHMTAPNAHHVPRAESRRPTQVPTTFYGLQCQTGRSTRPVCASPAWLVGSEIKKPVGIAWVEQEEYT